MFGWHHPQASTRLHDRSQLAIFIADKLRQLHQEPPGALNRLADAELFLHVPDPRGDGMDHRHSKIFLRRHHIDDTPGAGAEKIDALSIRDI